MILKITDSIRGLASMGKLPWATLSSVLLAAALTSGQASAVEEMEYSVQPGDTLIGLGEQLLVDARDWMTVQRLNRIKNPRRIPVGTILRIPFPLLRTEPVSAEITAASGDALIDGKPAENGMRVGAGTRIRTGENGYIALRLPDGSLMTLPSRSATHIEVLQRYPTLDGQDFTLKLEEGRLESYTETQRGPAARYRIDTPTAVIGVRGTDFRVGYDAALGETRAETTSGVVGVGSPRLPSVGKGQEHLVRAGFGAVAGADGGVFSQVLLPAPDVNGIPDFFDRPLIRFSVPKLKDAVAVRVQVTPEDGRDTCDNRIVLFDEVVRVAGAGSHDIRIPNLPDDDYRMRLRGVAANGLEGYDAEASFRLAARPEPPFLSHPPADSKVGAGQVGLQWTQSDGAAQYLIELGQDSAFNGPLLYQQIQERPLLVVDLAPGHYYWRLASVRPDGSHGPFSDVAHFEARAIPELEGMTGESGDDMQYAWSGEDGQRFDYQFAADIHFHEVLMEGTTEVPSVTLQRPPPDTYWMRVRAIDPDGFVGPWGAPQKIIIASSIPWWMLVLPLVIL